MLGSSAHSFEPRSLSQQDIKCLVIGLNMANSPAPQVKAASSGVILYFLGRLDGREPEIDIKKSVMEQLDSITNLDLPTESKRCGQMIVSQSQALAELGEVLQHRLPAAK
jgi:hypothetical protein